VYIILSLYVIIHHMKFIKYILLFLSFGFFVLAQTTNDKLNNDPVEAIKPETCVYISKNIFSKSKNKDDVINLKKFLQTTEYLSKSTEANGYFDKNTLSAILDFQTDNNLTKSRIFTEEMRKFINTYACTFNTAIFLKRNANLDVVDKYGDSPLIYATKSNQPLVAQMLIKAGANVNIVNNDGRTALAYSIINGMSTTSIALIKAGTNLDNLDNSTNTAFSLAIEKGDSVMAKLILNSGYDFNIQTDKGLSAANLAVVSGENSILSNLLSKGADIRISDENKATPLIYASFTDDSTTTTTILNFATSSAVIDDQDKYGRTALMYAIRNGNFDIVKLLLKKNPSLDIQDEKGMTTLIYAISNRQPNIARLLILKGADVNISDIEGKSPLMYSILYNLPDTYKLIKDKLMKDKPTENVSNTASSTATSTIVNTINVTNGIINLDKSSNSSGLFIPKIIPS
ncbi:MAG: ankyrin repeat domain-containing protein, partial [Candidatus Pacebacteria bacterium]|nr:ankyrin repeat domain-containing protein [Candidatus Paceibacterota bacterium]